MKKYTVAIYFMATILYEVEADSEVEAIDKAKDIEEPPDVFAQKVLEDIEYHDAMAVEIN